MTNSQSLADVNRANKELFTKSKTQICNFKKTATNKDVSVKVLGMTWDTQKDEIIFTLSELSEYASSLLLTKRSVLKATAKMYCHIPLTVAMKILFQDLCVNKSDWDSELHRETV